MPAAVNSEYLTVSTCLKQRIGSTCSEREPARRHEFGIHRFNQGSPISNRGTPAVLRHPMSIWQRVHNDIIIRKNSSSPLPDKKEIHEYIKKKSALGALRKITVETGTALSEYLGVLRKENLTNLLQRCSVAWSGVEIHIACVHCMYMCRSGHSRARRAGAGGTTSPGVDCRRPANDSLSARNIRQIVGGIFQLPCAE
eukprot:1195547-Prorocentrum_minimum.AAC.1